MKMQPIAADLLEMTAIFDQMLAALSTLKTLGDIQIDFTDRESFLHAALENLVENSEVAHCSIHLLTEGQPVLAAACNWRHSMEGGSPEKADVTEDQSSCPVPTAFLDEVIKTGRTRHYPDCSDETLLPAEKDSRGRKPGGCLITAPIHSGDILLGICSMSHPEANFFNEWHERIFDLFGAFLGQIIYKFRTLEELDREVAQRTQEIEKILVRTQRLEQHYRTLSLVDDLTGLYSRRFFFSEARMVLSRAARYHHPFSLLFLDLDDFKKINDDYGHITGDLVLKKVAKKLLSMLRDSDFLARFGGDEFTIVLPETDRQGAEILAERIVNAIAELSWTVEGQVLNISASIGLANLSIEEMVAYDSAKTDQIEVLLRQLLEEADQRMYASKRRK